MQFLAEMMWEGRRRRLVDKHTIYIYYLLRFLKDEITIRAKAYETVVPNIDNIINSSRKPVVSILIPRITTFYEA